jgi:putative tryptophan/tyrosine transport system substrate-binding protein
MNHVRRRQFLLAAAGLLFAPIYAKAQKATKPYRVGVFAAGSLKALQQSLNELGYVEGRHVVFEIRNPEGRSELFDPFALDLVRLKVDVIVASNPNAVLSAKRATTTIPIVMMHTPDPVQLGFVAYHPSAMSDPLLTWVLDHVRRSAVQRGSAACDRYKPADMVRSAGRP